jgi:hypothetical protein
VNLCISERVFGFPHACKRFRSQRKEPCFEVLKGLVGGFTLVDKKPKKMGEVDVKWMSEGPRFVPENYGLLLGERRTYPDLVTIGDEDETAGYALT